MLRISLRVFFFGFFHFGLVAMGSGLESEIVPRESSDYYVNHVLMGPRFSPPAFFLVM